MSGKDLRIVFMGTPEFAVPSLRALVAGGYNVVGVVTTPDKPAGRGQRMHESDVKIAARELGLPVLQPVKLRDPEFIEALRAWQPDLGIVIAFRMLPEVVWAMPRLGTFNLRLAAAPVPGCRTDQLGDHQRRDRNRRHDLPAEPRDRQGGHYRPDPGADRRGGYHRHDVRTAHGDRYRAGARYRGADCRRED